MIQLKNVTAGIRGELLLEDLSVCFESGTSYQIEGKNGVGKTTLLNLIAGKMVPRKGSIVYDFINEELDWDANFALTKKHLHFVPAQTLHDLISINELYYQQRYYTIEETLSPTVRDYIGKRLQNKKVMALPDSFQLDTLLDLELARLSNGQVKKVVILKQLLEHVPSTLLLDYPFEGLDVQSRIELRDFLDHLAKVVHIQLIIVDHDHLLLPTAITRKVLLDETGIHIVSRIAKRPIAASEIEIPTKRGVKEAAPVVEMHNVTIQYGGKVIIDKLNWKICKGERWALTGRNGSGKTTLFSMIYADHPMAYSEKVFLFGKRRGSGESIWDIKERICYLGPEQIHFLDFNTRQLTVQAYLENVKAPLEKLALLMTQFQIRPFLKKQLSQLSSGQLQLTFLLALFLRPKELLLLDEPFQFLDPQQKENLTRYLHSFLEESTTVILITHYEVDVQTWTHKRLNL